jgi:hypothetical protein
MLALPCSWSVPVNTQKLLAALVDFCCEFKIVLQVVLAVLLVLLTPVVEELLFNLPLLFLFGSLFRGHEEFHFANRDATRTFKDAVIVCTSARPIGLPVFLADLAAGSTGVAAGTTPCSLRNLLRLSTPTARASRRWRQHRSFSGGR